MTTMDKFAKDPFTAFMGALFGVPFEKLCAEAERNAKASKEVKEDEVKKDELDEKLKSFFERLSKAEIESEKAEPKYTIKTDDKFEEVHPDDLVDDDSTSFSMSKADLAEFVSSYTKLENTFRKLEHTYGIDLNANADSIYTQYNAIVWNLIEKIFGEDNRDDIADFCFGDSNLDTVDDLYEELV